MTEFQTPETQDTEAHPFDAGRNRAGEVSTDLILSAANDYAEIWRHMTLPDFVTLMRQENLSVQATEIALEAVIHHVVVQTMAGELHPNDRFGWQDGFELELMSMQSRLERFSQSPDRIIVELANGGYDLSQDAHIEIARLAAQACLNWFGNCLDLMVRGVPCEKLKIQPIDQAAPSLKPTLVYSADGDVKDDMALQDLYETPTYSRRDFRIVDEDGKLRPAIA